MKRDQKNTAIHIAYEDYEPHDAARPEKNLLRAMLLLAMSDLRKPGDVGRKAREYLLSREEDYLFSFQSVCNFLSIDPNTILILTGLKKSSASIAAKAAIESEVPVITDKHDA